MVAPKRRRPNCAAGDFLMYAFVQTVASQFGPRPNFSGACGDQSAALTSFGTIASLGGSNIPTQQEFRKWIIPIMYVSRVPN